MSPVDPGHMSGKSHQPCSGLTSAKQQTLTIKNVNNCGQSREVIKTQYLHSTLLTSFSNLSPHLVLSLTTARFYVITILLYFLLHRIIFLIKNPYKVNPSPIKSPAVGQQAKDNFNSSNLTITNAPVRKSEGNHDKNRPGWKKKIAMRKKNFGRLEEWSSEGGMKKVLLWTGYGPLQEGRQLWGRVLSDIGS